MNLKDKLKQEIQSKEQVQVDWDKRKKDWVASVKELDELIINWFSDYVDEGLLEFKKTVKTHTESYIGSYKVDVLHFLFANNREIVIEPMGTIILGAWGRYDVYAKGYNSDKYYILRNRNEDQSFSWNFVNAQTKRNIKPLSKEILEEVFEKWLS